MSISEEICAKIPHYVRDKPNSTVEIEFRTRIDEEKAVEIIGRKLWTGPTVQCSINFIDLKKNILSLPYVDNVKQQPIYYQKQPILNDVFLKFTHELSLKFSVNYEHTIKREDFNMQNVTYARIRIRYSCNIDADWRLDITLTKAFESFTDTKTIVDSRNALISDLNADNFAEKAPWKLVDKIELELEYCGDIGHFNFNKMISAKKHIHNIFLLNQQHIDNAYQNMLYEIAKYVKPDKANMFRNKFGLRQLSNQVQELNKNIFFNKVVSAIDTYYITPKLDGTRTLLFLVGDTINIINDKLETLKINTPTIVNNDVVDTIVNNDDTVISNDDTYLFDTEFYDNHYYIFDVLIWQSNVVTTQPFHDRIKYFKEAKKLYDKIRIKAFRPLKADSYCQQITTMLEESKKIYSIDGLVLTPIYGLYNDMIVYKYKQPIHLTIDFLIKRCPSHLCNVKPYVNKPNHTLYLLFCGITNDAYKMLSLKLIDKYQDIFKFNVKNLPRIFPIQFDPSERHYNYLYYHAAITDDLDGQIGEFRYVDNKWELVKLRKDKLTDVQRGNYFGNNYRTAEFIWMNICDPLIIEDIKEHGVPDYYFRQNDNLDFKAARNFNSFVKSNIIADMSDSKIEWLVDVACGKGQDIFRYASNGYKNILCLDRDFVALQELIDRKYELTVSSNRRYLPMNVLIHKVDFEENFQTTIKNLSNAQFQLPRNGCDVVICNFAIHYLARTNSSLKNFLKLISSMLSIGGTFVYTAFDGAEIIKKLGGKLDWTKEKYGIKTSRPITELQQTGQQISVLLPFSWPNYYDEYLVNNVHIRNELKMYGLNHNYDISFGEFLKQYSAKNPSGYASLTAADREFVSLYHVCSFTKVKGKALIS
jgi:hypothetical protein